VKVLSIVGARPQFVKLAPIARAFQNAGVEHIIVHTGQHYDALMSDVFFQELSIPHPDIDLGVGSGSHGKQTGKMLAALEDVISDRRPDWVLVYGDTNSTLAGSLAAVKLGQPLAHLEAGLRSFNRAMPEEINRVLTDHASDLLLAPTQIAFDNLRNEGLEARTKVVGDVMVDICQEVIGKVDKNQLSEMLGGLIPKNYVVATIHRAENTDNFERLGLILTALQKLPIPVILPVHPRLRQRSIDAGYELERGSVIATAPLSYSNMIGLVSQATAVVTDSGGLQKEAFILGTRCLTLRRETEWTETLWNGWNELVPDPGELESHLQIDFKNGERPPLFGNGDAAEQVVNILLSRSI
jgi:UDP-N-acetylglucosamine 2-epimerase (non-hydrolysing)